MAFGILLILLGGLAFASIVMATIVSVYFVAITMVLAGAAEISLGLRSTSRSGRPTWVLLGILYVGAGLFALFNPLLAAWLLTLLLGASLESFSIIAAIKIPVQIGSDPQQAELASITLLAKQWGVLGVCIAVALSSCLVRGIGRMLIGCHVLGVRPPRFIAHAVLPRMMPLAGTALAATLVLHPASIKSFPDFVAIGRLYAVTYFTIGDLSKPRPNQLGERA